MVGLDSIGVGGASIRAVRIEKKSTATRDQTAEAAITPATNPAAIPTITRGARGLDRLADAGALGTELIFGGRLFITTGEFFLHFGECPDRKLDVLAGMSGGDLGANAGFALRHDGI